MTVSVLKAAKHLARRSDWSLTNLEMQKILYLAHMFYLGRSDEPLVDGHFEAWNYGPVHPTLYHRLKIFGSDPVENIFHGVLDLSDGPEQEILDEAFESLGHVGPGRLVSATHRKDGAWDKNYDPARRHGRIANTDIQMEYRDLDGND